MDSDFQIEESINDFSAIGCGESYALGSLYSSSNLTPQKRVKKALEAASYFSGGVYPPFILKNT